MRRKFFLFFLFCIFLPAQAGAEEVFTFGNGDFIHEIIQAVATYCGGGEFGTLLKLMAVLALFAGLIKGLIVQTQGRGDMLSEAFKTFLMVLLLYYICFVPKTSVIIRDELFNTQTQVDDVPWGLAFMASLTTSIEKSIAKAFDTVYSIPDDLKFTESGYNFGLLALEGTLHQGVINPYIQHNWSCYIADCVVPAVLTGNINEAQLSWENDILGSNVLQTHYANFFTTHYDPNNGSVTHPSCRDDYATIKQETINHINSEIAPYFARRVAGIGGAASQWVQADVMNRLGAAGSYFLTLAGSGQQILQQAVMMNVINEARTSVMARYATDPTALQVAQAIANLQARYSLSTGAEMAKTYVPALRRILEGIIYGIFPIIIAIAFIPFFRNALLKSYFYLFFWLIWWSPIFSVINLIVTTRGRSILSAYDGFFCLGNINPLANGFIDLVGVAGNLLWAVPILSFFIATGSVYAAVAGFRSLGAHVQALSHSAGVSTSPTPAGTSTMTRTGSELTTKQTGESMGLSWREMGQATARVSPMTMQGAFQRMYGMGTDWSGKVGNYAHSAGMGQNLGMRTGKIAGETTRGKLFGTLGAYHEAYTNGFRGSFTEFNKEMSNIATQTNFASARSVQNAANNSPFYQGNTQRLLQDQANFQMQRTATMLTTMREQGYSPETVGTALGGIRALENIASTDWAKQAGLRSVYTKKAGELYNELSKMTIRQALTDIAEKGSITPETQQILHNIAASPIGRAQLAAQGIGDRMIKPEEARNVAMWLQSQGVDVSAKDLEGATAQMNVWTDKSGNIHMGFLATRKGKTVAEYDLKSMDTGTRVTDGTFMKRGTQKTIHGWMGRVQDKKQGIDYFFVSGDRIQKGDMVTVKGITEGGQEVSLVQNARTGEVISHHASAGPEGYKGALAMAAAGNEPHEVFTNRVASVRFAHDYAGELKGHYNVEISRADLNRFYQGISGALGGGIVASARAHLERRHGTDWQSISTRDLAQATAYAILTNREMGINEKKARMQLLTEKILNIDTTRPKEIPKGKETFSDATKPAEAVGPSGGPPISTITGKPDTHAEAIMQEHGILSGKITDKLPHGGR